MSCTWTTISIYYNKLQKKLFQKFIHMKKKIGEKGYTIFFLNNHVGSLYLVCTLDWVKDSTQMNMIINVGKGFTISPNLVVEPKCPTFEAFTMTEAI